MFLRIGKKLLNTENLVDGDVYEPGEDLSPHREGQAETRTVVLTTTALEPDQDGRLGARRIWLEGDDTDLFLEALPVYSPVFEGAPEG